MPKIGHLICLTPRDSYVVDEPTEKGILARLEGRIGPFVRSPGIAFPYLVGFLRKNGALEPDTRIAVQHDKIEGPTPFTEILTDKVDVAHGEQDVLLVTGYTNSAREAYRRAREARAAWAAAGKRLTVVMGGPHASAMPDEGPSRGYVDATVAGEGEWATSALLADLLAGRALQTTYRATWDRIRERGTLTLDMGIWNGLRTPPQQIVASTHLARGCKLDCSFCGVFLTNGPTVRNRDVADVVDELQAQGPAVSRDTIGALGPGFYNRVLKALVRTPGLGHLWGDKLISLMGPGFTHRFFFWDDNLYNSAGMIKAVCNAIRPLNRIWSAELTIDLAERPELLKLAYDSGCRDLFLGIESVSQTAIDGLGKWSNQTNHMRESVKRVHDAGINVMGAFVFGLEGDTPSCFDETLEFINDTGIDFIVANIVQPYPGTAVFREALAAGDFLPWTYCPPDVDTPMDYNWPLFDGAHVLIRPKGMTVDQLQEGYYYFLREAYSIAGIQRRFRGRAWDLPWAMSHMARNYMLSRYGMIKTAHALRRTDATGVGMPTIVAGDAHARRGPQPVPAHETAKERRAAAVRRRAPAVAPVPPA